MTAREAHASNQPATPWQAAQQPPATPVHRAVLVRGTPKPRATIANARNTRYPG